VAWLKDESRNEADDLPEPDVLLAEIRARLEDALAAVTNVEGAL
jgi:hypothetical protein